MSDWWDDLPRVTQTDVNSDRLKKAMMRGQPGSPDVGQGISEAGEDFLPMAWEGLKSFGRGGWDLAGGNVPQADTLGERFKEALMDQFGMTPDRIKNLPQEQQPYSQERFRKTRGAALLKGSQNILNAIPNIIDWQKEHGYMPDTFDTPRLPDFISKYDFSQDPMFQVKGERPGDTTMAGVLP